MDFKNLLHEELKIPDFRVNHSQSIAMALTIFSTESTNIFLVLIILLPSESKENHHTPIVENNKSITSRSEGKKRTFYSVCKSYITSIGQENVALGLTCLRPTLVEPFSATWRRALPRVLGSGGSTLWFASVFLCFGTRQSPGFEKIWTSQKRILRKNPRNLLGSFGQGRSFLKAAAC